MCTLIIIMPNKKPQLNSPRPQGPHLVPSWKQPSLGGRGRGREREREGREWRGRGSRNEEREACREKRRRTKRGGQASKRSPSHVSNFTGTVLLQRQLIQFPAHPNFPASCKRCNNKIPRQIQKRGSIKTEPNDAQQQCGGVHAAGGRGWKPEKQLPLIESGELGSEMGTGC